MAALSVLAWANGAVAECRLQPGPQRTVTRVIDGETLLLDDGSEVRLAGALAPRAFDVGADDANWPAARAARTALAAMTEGRNVVLGTTGTAKRDRHNRHVAQVFVIEDGKETWVQGRMLLDGHARAYQQKDQRGCAVELLAHEAVARRANAGLWAVDAYRARPAIRTQHLEGMAGKFVVLTGRIAWVADGREVIALGFTPARGRAWNSRYGITVMIENRDRELLGGLGGDAQALAGKNVEVRGWLEQRLRRPAGAFVMDVSLAGMIITVGDERTVSTETANDVAPPADTATTRGVQ